MPSHAADQQELAEHFKVSRQTVAQWAMKSDFPTKEKKGWPIKAIDTWAKKNHLGPYRNGEKSKGEKSESPLTAAKLTLADKKATREDIAIKRDIRELGLETKEILLAADIEELHRQIASTAMTLLSAFEDAIDREAPEACPTPEAWPELRKRLILVSRRSARDVASAIEGFIAGDRQVE